MRFDCIWSIRYSFEPLPALIRGIGTLPLPLPPVWLYCPHVKVVDILCDRASSHKDLMTDANFGAHEGD